MSSDLRPFTTYKAVGGVLAVLGLGRLAAEAFGPEHHAGSSLTVTILMAVVGAMGLAAFVYADREMQKRSRSEETKTASTSRPWYTPDWKAIGIACAALLLYLLVIILKARNVL